MQAQKLKSQIKEKPELVNTERSVLESTSYCWPLETSWLMLELPPPGEFPGMENQNLSIQSTMYWDPLVAADHWRQAS